MFPVTWELKIALFEQCNISLASLNFLEWLIFCFLMQKINGFLQSTFNCLELLFFAPPI